LKRLREGDGELKAKQRLHARQDEARLGQQLLDLGSDGGSSLWRSGHGWLLSFESECQAVPKSHCEGEECRRNSHSGAEARNPLHCNKKIKRQGDREGRQGQGRQPRGERQDRRMILPVAHNAVLKRRRHEERNGDRDQAEGRAHEHFEQGRKILKTLLKNAVELKAEQDLRAQNQEAAFIESKFELALEFHALVKQISNGVMELSVAVGQMPSSLE